MKKIILTLAFFTILLSNVFAQIEAKTKDGKDVILNANGTWEYVKTEMLPIIEKNNDDCSSFIETTEDKVSGNTMTASKEMLIVSKDGGKNGFGIYIIEAQKSIIFSIKAVGAGNCIDDDEKMNILFRDGTRLVLTNDGDFNCDAEYTQYFGGVFGKKKELEMFRTKEIETMRIWTSDSYVEEDFTSEQSNELLHIVDCLMNN